MNFSPADDLSTLKLIPPSKVKAFVGALNAAGDSTRKTADYRPLVAAIGMGGTIAMALGEDGIRRPKNAG